MAIAGAEPHPLAEDPQLDAASRGSDAEVHFAQRAVPPPHTPISLNTSRAVRKLSIAAGAPQ